MGTRIQGLARCTTKLQIPAIVPPCAPVIPAQRSYPHNSQDRTSLGRITAERNLAKGSAVPGHSVAYWSRIMTMVPWKSSAREVMRLQASVGATL